MRVGWCAAANRGQPQSFLVSSKNPDGGLAISSATGAQIRDTLSSIITGSDHRLSSGDTLPARRHNERSLYIVAGENRRILTPR
jgi:hypothetical protein